MGPLIFTFQPYVCIFWWSESWVQTLHLLKGLKKFSISWHWLNTEFCHYLHYFNQYSQIHFSCGLWEDIWSLDLHRKTSCWLDTPHLQRVYDNYLLIALLTLFLQKPPIPFWEDIIMPLKRLYVVQMPQCDLNWIRQLHKQQLKAWLSLFLLITIEALSRIQSISSAANVCWCAFAMIKASLKSCLSPTHNTRHSHPRPFMKEASRFYKDRWQ